MNHTLEKLSLPQTRSPIKECVQAELEMYFNLLDGQPPHNLYRMVMDQAERALITTVLKDVMETKVNLPTILD